MRIAIVLVFAWLVGVGASPAAAAVPTTLSITTYPRGIGELGALRFVLRCGPAGGTVPHPVVACRALARLARPFAPVPPGTTCSDLALGPEEAIVTGRVRGEAVEAHLTVRDSCEIERWRRLAAVVPGFPGRP